MLHPDALKHMTVCCASFWFSEVLHVLVGALGVPLTMVLLSFCVEAWDKAWKPLSRLDWYDSQWNALSLELWFTCSPCSSVNINKNHNEQRTPAPPSFNIPSSLFHHSIVCTSQSFQISFSLFAYIFFIFLSSSASALITQYQDQCKQLTLLSPIPYQQISKYRRS